MYFSLTAHKKREAMLILASPRFLLCLLIFVLVPTSTLQTRALLLRFRRKLQYWVQDTLRFLLSNHREYRTHRDCPLVFCVKIPTATAHIKISKLVKLFGAAYRLSCIRAAMPLYVFFYIIFRCFPRFHLSTIL